MQPYEYGHNTGDSSFHEKDTLKSTTDSDEYRKDIGYLVSNSIEFSCHHIRKGDGFCIG